MSRVIKAGYCSYVDLCDNTVDMLQFMHMLELLEFNDWLETEQNKNGDS